MLNNIFINNYKHEGNFLVNSKGFNTWNNEESNVLIIFWICFCLKYKNEMMKFIDYNSTFGFTSTIT